MPDRRRFSPDPFQLHETDIMTTRPRHNPSPDPGATPRGARPAEPQRGPADPTRPEPEPPRSHGELARTRSELAQALAETARLEAEVEKLEAELAAAGAEVAENTTTLQRTAAEFANYRRRTTEERERDAGLASQHLLRKVITIADDFDRAVDARPAELAGNAWAEGIAAIDRKLRALLESEGVRAIEAVGRQFDPREHESITSLAGTGRPDGEVIAEAQRGYRLRDRVLRPALVIVAGGDGGEDSRGPGPVPANDSADGHITDNEQND
jgi:molecular chaperone GrpE